MSAIQKNGQKYESSSFDHEDESSPFALSSDTNVSEDGLLTLVEIARRIETDDSKHAAVLAKIKRLVAHESVRELLGAQRAGGKGFRYPDAAVEKMHYLVTNPLVSAANADEYLKTLTPDSAPAALARTTESSLFNQGGESSMSAFLPVAEIIGAAIRQAGERSEAALVPLIERMVVALEGQEVRDRAVTKCEAARIMGIAESSVNRLIPALTPGYVSELDIQAWLKDRREKAALRRNNRKERIQKS